MIFDAHCDVLYKLFLDESIDFKNSNQLHVNFNGLHSLGAKIQCFAIYIPTTVHPDHSFQAALTMVELFFEKIIRPFPNIKFITSKSEIDRLTDNEIGVILTLEGCDAIGKHILKLKTLLELGVSSVGLTWNFANDVADGALEKRGAGLTQFGIEVVELLNETNTWIDVSHLSERGFWDVIERGKHPFASHSNSYKLCPHPRNLKDDQIEALIKKDSVIGITFVPQFLAQGSLVGIEDVLRHVDHVCALGGVNHLGFGSDFDGIEETVVGLESIRDYELLINELLKYYPEIQVKGFLFDNMKNRFPRP